jgi:hypothetical protein
MQARPAGMIGREVELMRVRTLIGTLVLLGGLTGCGGGGSSGDERSSGGSSVDNPAGVLDPQFHGIHYHQDFFENPRNFAFDWSVRNDTDVPIRNLRWRIRRLDGPNPMQQSGTIATVAAHEEVADGHNYHVEWQESETGTFTYAVTLDPDNRIVETDESNNTYLFTITVPGTTRLSVPDDLKFYQRTAHFHGLLPGDRYVFHFELANTGSQPRNNVVWSLICPELGIDERTVVDRVDAGDHVETSHGVTITAEGEFEFHVIIDPDDHVAEEDEGNNDHRFIVFTTFGDAG